MMNDRCHLGCDIGECKRKPECHHFFKRMEEKLYPDAVVNEILNDIKNSTSSKDAVDKDDL